MQAVDLTLKRLVSIWWALFWRSLIVVTGGSFVAGCVGGVVLGAIEHPEMAKPVGFVLGLMVSIPGSLWSLRAALSHKYGDFSILMVRPSSEAPVSATAASG